MCGIVGYVGTRQAVPILMDGLKRLEYRGYDSAGIAVANGHEQFYLRRSAGKLANLEALIGAEEEPGGTGIAHTRWATHGRPSEENAHPHRSQDDNVVLVHNGIIENYLQLKQRLEDAGHTIRTETDSEICAHMVGSYMDQGDPLEEAVRKTIKDLTGSFAFAVISLREKNKLVAARLGPPIVIGIGEGEAFVASDVTAILHHTRQMIFLDDNEMAVLTPESIAVTDFHGTPITRDAQSIAWDPVLAEKGGYKHFMLKEIFEQPRAVQETTLSRVSRDTGKIFLDEMDITEEEFRKFRSVKIIACGTSWHAGLCGKLMIEKLARIPVEVDYGSEFRYREPIVDPETLTIVISQSGETADTLAAQREAKQQGSKTLAICNVVGSMITREAAGTVYTHAGPEIGVASTKAFTSQLTALFILAMYLGQQRRTLDGPTSVHYVEDLLLIPGKIDEILANETPYEELTKLYWKANDALFLGRGIHFPIALEGALKLKEISYIHAEGYPAGEMKHGPNALIDENLPVVFLATMDPRNPQSRLKYEKTLSNIQEVQAREGKVIAVVVRGDTEVRDVAEHVIEIPPTSEMLLPILEIIPLQLLAYHIAVRRGCDVDQPRNLAKSVTVE